MKKLILLILVIPGLLFGGTVQQAHKSVISRMNAGGCTPTYGSELNDHDNASMPSASDTDATTGWVNSGVSVLDSVTTAPQLGTYHITATSDSDNDDFYADISSWLTDQTKTYLVSLMYRHSGTGGDWTVGLGLGGFPFLATLNFTDAVTTYQEYRTYISGNSSAWTSVILRENNAGDDGTVYVDNFTVTEATNFCLGTELHDDSNAAGVSSEADATTGFTNAWCDVFQSTSSGTPSDGSYHIEFSSNITPATSARVYKDIGTDFSLQVGTRYYISIDVKHVGTGGTWRFGLGASNGDPDSFPLDAAVAVSDTTYGRYGVSFVYAVATNRYLVFKEGNGDQNGGLYIDRLTLKEITDE